MGSDNFGSFFYAFSGEGASRVMKDQRHTTDLTSWWASCCRVIDQMRLLFRQPA